MMQTVIHTYFLISKQMKIFGNYWDIYPACCRYANNATLEEFSGTNHRCWLLDAN